MEALGQAVAEALPEGGVTTSSDSARTGLRPARLARATSVLRTSRVRQLCGRNFCQCSIRPTGFFSNFDKYDLPPLLDGSLGSSPLGQGEWRVN